MKGLNRPFFKDYFMWPGSGFITIITYATTVGHVQKEDFQILTELDDVITDESGIPLEIEH